MINDMNEKKIKHEVLDAEEFLLQPTFSKILVMMAPDPFKELKTESGIWVPDLAISDKSGKAETQEPLQFYGVILNKGHEVTTVDVGDSIYYQPYAGHPVFFGHEGYVVMNERDILTVIKKKE